MHMPNFFVVGAAKAGTTSIHYYLDQHPEIYMSPIKEPHYFSKDIRCKNFTQHDYIKSCLDIEKYLSNKVLEKKHIAFIENEIDYLALFRDVNQEVRIGEISNGYLFSKVAAKEIFEFNPNAKIIIVLREPIERAFSHWIMDLRGRNVCRKSFLDAIKEDQSTEDKGWGVTHLYVELGQYYAQVKRYLDVFPRNQVLIMTYDDFKINSETFYNQLFSFLEVSPKKVEGNKKINVAGIPKFPLINNIIKKSRINIITNKILPSNKKEKIKLMLTNNDNLPSLTLDDRKETKYYFKNDIKLLEKIIDKDLSKWLS